MKKWLAQVALVFVSLSFLGGVFAPFATSAQPFLDDSVSTTGSDSNNTGVIIPNFTNPADVSVQNVNDPNQGNTGITGAGAFTPQKSLLPVCSVIPGEEGSLEGCIVRFVYYAVLYPSAWLAGVGGSVFDWFAGYTLSSDSYSQAGFVERGWRVIRDLANLSFIFVLLYIAFRYVLGLEGRDVQKTLVKIIGAALILNFSLFTTRVIIDAGNIIARVFYEKIIVTGGESSGGHTPLSVGLISKVNPQRLLTQKMFDPQTTLAAQTQNTNNTLGETNGQVDSQAGSIGFMILVLLIAAAVNLALAYVLFSVGIFFVARTIGLWFQMIFSPVAFLSIAIPKIGGRFEFKKWFQTTIELSFLVVVFMFFLYLIIMFLDIAFASLIDSNENASGLTLFLEVLIPFVVVLLLLVQAKKQAKSMSGEFGEGVVKGLKMAIIGALGTAGLALGGAAVVGGALGRQSLGRAGAALANRDAKTATGRAFKRAGKYLSTASFDARNINIPKPVTSTLRSGLSYATGQEIAANEFRLRATGKGTTKGGLETRRQKYVEDKIKDAKNLAQDENTNISTTYVDNNNQKQTINISVSEAKRNFEREKLSISRKENYDEKKRSQEKIQKDYEDKKKKYEIAQRKLQDGIITQTDYNKIRDDFSIVENAKATIDKTVKDIESKWGEKERIMKAAQASLGSAKADHYRDYAESVGTFLGGRYDPRNRRDFAAGAVEDLAYQEDKKNEKNKSNNNQNTGNQP